MSLRLRSYRVKVKNIIARDLTAVTRDMTVAEAIHLMSSHRVGGLPVVDQEFRVAGFVSEKDILETAYPYAEIGPEDLFITAHLSDLVRELGKLGGRLVSDCMTEPALSVAEDEELDHAAEKMLSHKLKILPVTREGRLVGVIRRRDIALALIEEGDYL
jgi:CBS domain-containing protein